MWRPPGPHLDVEDRLGDAGVGHLDDLVPEQIAVDETIEARELFSTGSFRRVRVTQAPERGEAHGFSTRTPLDVVEVAGVLVPRRATRGQLIQPRAFTQGRPAARRAAARR